MLNEAQFLEKDQQWLSEQAKALNFPKALKAWRQCEELTQLELAELLGVSKQYVSSLERGIRRPSLKEARRIGEVLGAGDIFALLVLKQTIEDAGLSYLLET